MVERGRRRVVAGAKRPVCGGMKVRTYPVLCRAVEEGVAYGWRRAHKHNDKPDALTIEEQIVNAFLIEVCKYFEFDDDAED
jgi:hypothetical protein